MQRTRVFAALLTITLAAPVGCAGSTAERPNAATNPANPNAPETPAPPSPMLAAPDPLLETRPPTLRSPTQPGHMERGGDALPDRSGMPGMSDMSDMRDTPSGYTCPMHPEVHSAKPGQCPKCGMQLVSQKPGAQP